MGEKLKNAGKSIMNGAIKVKNFIKFMGTAFGHIVMLIALGLICVILLYILIETVSVSLKKLFGIEDAGIRDTNDYAVLQQLKNSGYNTLMDSQTLAEYLNYEYAVVMDAARYFSETGVYELEPERVVDFDIWNESIKIEERAKFTALVVNNQKDSKEYKELAEKLKLRTLANPDEKKYKELCDRLNGESEKVNTESGELSVAWEKYQKATKDLEKAKKDKETGKITSDELKVYENEQHVYETQIKGYNSRYKQKDQEKLDKIDEKYIDRIKENMAKKKRDIALDIDKLDRTWGELKLKIDLSQTTSEKETAYAGYEKVYKELNKKYKSSLLTNGNSGIDLFYKVAENGTMDNQKSLVPYLRIFRDARINTYYLREKSPFIYDITGLNEIPDNKALADRITDGDPISPGSPEWGKYQAFVEGAIQGGYMYNYDLNSENKDLFLHSSVTGGGDILTTTRDYPHDKLFYEKKDDGSATYEIPFRVLLERFLPKATLLSSWYMLKDSTDDGEIEGLLTDIKEIYNEACLSGEKSLGEDRTQTLLYKFMKMMKWTPEKLAEYRSENNLTPLDIEKLEYEEQYSNLVSFITFQRLYFEFYNGGKWKVGATEIFTPLTDLVHAAEMGGTYTRTGTKAREKLDENGKKVLDEKGNVVIEYDSKTFDATPQLESMLSGDFPIEYNGRMIRFVPLIGEGIVLNSFKELEKRIENAATDERSIPSLEGWYHIVNDGDGSKLNIDDTAGLISAMAEQLDKKLKQIMNSEGYSFDYSSVENNIDVGGEKGPRPVYTKEKIRFSVTIDVKIKKMPAYFPADAETWSRSIEYQNRLIEGNEFKEDNVFSLLPTQIMGFGFSDLEISDDSEWRVEMYGPLFTDVREKDFIAMVAEWETAADEGLYGADTYIRDLYKLIQYSKPDYLIASGLSTVHPNNYKYINIPEEILYYDELTTDYAFWLEHLEATTEDPIEPEENLTMRSRIPLMKWQQVDYQLYDECEDKGNNTYKVYALWPEGGYMSKSYYAISANSSADTNEFIESWGGWKYNGTHPGVDLYGRKTTDEILTAMASTIRSEISGKSVRLVEVSDASKWAGTDIYDYDPDEPEAVTPEGLAAGGYSTTDYGVRNYMGQDTSGVADDSINDYVKNIRGSAKVLSKLPKLSIYKHSPAALKLDGTTYLFPGTASAIYGYELWRVTKARGDAEEAAAILNRQMYKEAKDMPIIAAAPGIVKQIKANPAAGFGVVIQHTNGAANGEVRTSYAHMKRYPLVQEGEYVGAGTVLGYEGTTGNSRGLHLHFEIAVSDETGTEHPGTYPIPYLYPFFTPFYKEPEEGADPYEMSDEHMSLIRTVFPVGQIVPSDMGTRNGIKYVKESDGRLTTIQPYLVTARKGYTIDQVQLDNENKVVIKNYVPTLALLDDYIDLATKADERLADNFLEKPEYLKITGGAYDSYDDVEAYLIYFDPAFLEMVGRFNGYIITGYIDVNKYVYDNDKLLLGDGGRTYGVSQWKQLEFALEEKVFDAGYGSRAGTVAAARFLAGMERMVPYLGQKAGGVYSDVGVYAHRGLNVTWGGPAINAGEVYNPNGFDCTGFVRWCLINGGVKPELFNGVVRVGTRMEIVDAISKNLVRPGDIVCSEDGEQFRHIAIVIGVSDGIVYVAEEQGRGLIITEIYSNGENSRKDGLNVIYIDENNQLYPSDGNMDKLVNTWTNKDGRAVGTW